MKSETIRNVTFIHGDCMEFLKEQKENAFDLAIVDPPYGIGGGVDNRNAINTKSGNNLKRLSRAGGMNWDRKTPDKIYFDYVFNVSNNQIIWGGNYFIENLKNTRCFICWDKMTYIPTMSQMELAWTSFKGHTRYIKINSNQVGRIHISQKPVQLYKWLLLNYAQPGQTILDTHGGSGSIAIACFELGFKLTIIEKDKEYFDNMVERFKTHIKQLKLF